MDKPFQRVGPKSNSHIGADFELAAQKFFGKIGLVLERNVKASIGIDRIKKDHAFDLGSQENKVIVECKSHKWTQPGGNVPSAKLTVWNEAMYYFVVAPDGYRKILFVLYDFNEKRKETLAEYYMRTYAHLIPCGVELWEYNEAKHTAEQLF